MCGNGCVGVGGWGWVCGSGGVVMTMGIERDGGGDKGTEVGGRLCMHAVTFRIRVHSFSPHS